MRSEPAATAAEVGRLPLGAVVTVIEERTVRESVGDSRGEWVRIAPAAWAGGWIAGRFTRPYDRAGREAIVRALGRERLAVAELSFADLADLEAFASRAGAGMSADGAAEMELVRFGALARAAALIPSGRARVEPYASWVESRGNLIFYNELGGEWLVRSEAFWDAAARHASSAAGDDFAWAAARNELGGECEGFLLCYLRTTAEMPGRYLRMFPNGRHAGEALGRIEELVSAADAEDSGYESHGEEADIRTTLSELRAVVAGAAHPKGKAVLAGIDRLARRFR